MSERFCPEQMKCKEDTDDTWSCRAHMAEGSVRQCPYKSYEDSQEGEYPCADAQYGLNEAMSKSEQMLHECPYTACKGKQLQAELATVKEENRWIPVEEGLPKDACCVNVVMERGNERWGFLSYYNTTKKIWEPYDPMVKGVVTHWRPIRLPEGE